MPCLEVILPRTDAQTKKRLAEELTKAFAQSTGFEADIFGVHFNEYSAGDAAVGGKVWDGTRAPFLHMTLACPRLRRQAKQKAVEALTGAFVQGVGKPDWKPVIHINEHPYDNVGVEGKLLSDSYEECAKKNFYYSLPKD